MSQNIQRIIIIDDEERMCQSLTSLLEGDGFEVRSFQESPQAVELVRREKVDLIITDIKMPKMDGIEILRAVKEIDEGIPVILMTGYGSLDTAIEAVSEGAYDYLLKPVEFTYLELAVKRALEKRRAELSRLKLLEELKLSNLILQRRMGELNALYEAGKSIGSLANLKDLLKQIVVLASSVTEAQIGSIMLLDDRRELLTIEASIGLDEKVVNETRLPIGASIAGYVAKTGEPIIVEDVENDDRFKRINRERYRTASLLSVPLKIKNDILGVINMSNKEGNTPFTSDDLRLLTTFASQAAVAVDDAYQFEKSRRRLEEFQILHEISIELPNIQTWNEFSKLLVKKMARVFPVDYTLLLIWDEKSNTLVPEDVTGDVSLPITESGRINTKKINPIDLVLPEIEFDNLEDIPKLSLYLGEKLKQNRHFPTPRDAYMAIPIWRRGKLAYIFYLGADSGKAYSDDDISLARLVVSQATLLFEKETAILNTTRLITMGNMISEISHDLRKPLTSIKGGLQIIKQRLADQLENSDIMKMVEDEIHRMNELVRELVDFSNPNRYETQKLNLQLIIKRAAELVGPDLRKQNMEYESSFEQNVDWEVIVNKNQILEVFLNLFINAIQAMGQGGKLIVVGQIEKPDHKNEEYLAVKVIDNGCGIKKENQSKIFDRYYTTKEAGTGLGLAVVERIISAHNWTFKIDSTENVGTTFTVYIPINE